jgi:hypothetical protein
MALFYFMYYYQLQDNFEMKFDCGFIFFINSYLTFENFTFKNIVDLNLFNYLHFSNYSN